jgi:hypothetical protein
MSGTWDANIVLVYIVCEDRFFAIDALDNGEAFDVLADVRIGRNLMQFVNECELCVSVRNLSQSSTLLRRRQSYPLAPQDAPLDQQLLVKFSAGWNASDGDVLEVLATFKVKAGINRDYSLARSAPFIVTN